MPYATFISVIEFWAVKLKGEKLDELTNTNINL